MTNLDEWRAWRSDVLVALEAIRRVAPAFSLELVAELVRVGELRVALEILWDNLHEAGIVLPHDAKPLLVEVSRRLGVDASYWRDH